MNFKCTLNFFWISYGHDELIAIKFSKKTHLSFMQTFIQIELKMNILCLFNKKVDQSKDKLIQFIFTIVNINNMK